MRTIESDQWRYSLLINNREKISETTETPRLSARPLEGTRMGEWPVLLLFSAVRITYLASSSVGDNNRQHQEKSNGRGLHVGEKRVQLAVRWISAMNVTLLSLCLCVSKRTALKKKVKCIDLESC